ncbi:MAG: HAMP domain-containing sensor histidine kinase [Sulfurimonas sp.]|nr:HAMP domain-containing sensor histidine kinase [Sulfurimonas sp.]
MISRTNFFTSGWDSEAVDSELKSKFQMINIAILLSSVGLIAGIMLNIVQNINIRGLIPFELLLLGMNVFLFILLRYKKETLQLVSLIETGQFTLLFLVLVYVSEPDQLKHIWVFTYPVVLLYFQREKSSVYWVVIMITGLLIAPLQPYIEVSYTLYQVIYISIVLAIISIITYFYQIKMDEARNLIKKQVDQLMHKDKLLTLQSKQAVMGEMISMIAHQWRQPLSTITLSISDLQVKKMLGKDIDDKYMDEALQNISDTIIYLSDTIDDFQTYFAPNKNISEEKITDIISRAINFIKTRIKSAKIELEYKQEDFGLIETYSNELVQVILNVINNAIDELVDKKIPNPKLSISIEENKRDFIITIKDNGEGISLENIESIFEPYYSTKGKNGTGLGLYMSQMIMQKQFNSKIQLQSSKDGTEFYIRVPKKLV